MDMDLVLKEIEREDLGQQAVARELATQGPGPTPEAAIAQLETAIAALQRAREDPEMAYLVPEGAARLEFLERDASALLAELLARRG